MIITNGSLSMAISMGIIHMQLKNSRQITAAVESIAKEP
jgi:hypothetical protein